MRWLRPEIRPPGGRLPSSFVCKRCNWLNQLYKSDSAWSKDNRPGKGWIKGFLARHPDLFEWTPQSLDWERAEVTAAGIGCWFEEMKKYMDSQDTSLLESLERLYNAGKSGFAFCPKNRQVLAFKGSKHIHNVTSNTKNQVTALACMSGTGHYLPPLLIFPYKRIPYKNLLEGFPEAQLQICDSGWITAFVFYIWLRDTSRTSRSQWHNTPTATARIHQCLKHLNSVKALITSHPATGSKLFWGN
ncbi:tigger transposable element-derived protein 6-like protein [Plakobranchus ocellatus]|uniref:Tigger transposable element-derived protein 6-like protein n=1 Tax=Plakobranchus ocellatus TaxID=259542 RepID=A0AAV4C3Z6_9GAST|nr:tigger transposable element-derived protein 6-like protein [Plakobranchus ocellatus]